MKMKDTSRSGGSSKGPSLRFKLVARSSKRNGKEIRRAALCNLLLLARSPAPSMTSCLALGQIRANLGPACLGLISGAGAVVTQNSKKSKFADSNVDFLEEFD